MDQLIKTTTNENGEVILSGRELHGFLEVQTPYKKWFDRMVEYGFIENIDFIVMDKIVQDETVFGGVRKMIDHVLKLDMAKEISMIQRNEKGKQARQYFLEIERQWNSPEMVMKRAMDYLNAKVAQLTTTNLKLEQQVKEYKPKADYVDSILKNKGLVTIGQIAKDYGMSAVKMNELLHKLKVQYKQSGQWLLYAKYQAKGYTHSETINITRTDGSPDVKMNTKWTQKGRLFIYELLKGEGILPMIEQRKDGIA